MTYQTKTESAYEALRRLLVKEGYTKDTEVVHHCLRLRKVLRDQGLTFLPQEDAHG